jgi:hypothetical protein
MRERRLYQRGTPALQAAVASGLVTTYRAGEIAKLSVSEQEIAVAQWSNRSLARIQGQAIAALVIRGELGKAEIIDLDRILSTIREAVERGSPSDSTPP